MHTYIATGAIQLINAGLAEACPKFTSESEALWGEREEVPSFAIVAHAHAFAWDPNCSRTG